jgi:hypothetical protein
MQISAAQAEHLLTSSTTAAAAAAGLASTLAALRCLSVELGPDPCSLRHAGRLVGSCSGLTKLELLKERGHWVCDGTSVVEGLDEVAAAHAAPAAAAEGSGGGTSQGGGSRQPPYLQHLDIGGPLPGFVTYWMGCPQAAALTTLCLSATAVRGVHMPSLAACSNLRELVLEWQGGVGKGSGVSVQSPFPDELTQLTSLTKLVMDSSGLKGPVPAVVWALTQLRHLSMRWCHDLLELPPEISSLKQLTFLDIGGTKQDGAASQLAAWLPQLEVLAMEDSPRVGAGELTRLTRLTRLTCSADAAAAVDGLGQLKEAHLNVWDPYLAPPLTPLGRLTALEVLSLGLEEGGVALGPCLLPSLRRLDLIADNPAHVAHQLLGPALHLTHLRLTTCGEEQEGAILQLGMLPVLKELDCSWIDVLGAGPWLQQHPHLTKLHLHDPYEIRKGLPLPQLPPQLQDLYLSGNIDHSDVPQALVQLTGLRVFKVCNDDRLPLPSWVSQLSSLERLDASDATFSTGWEALSNMPLLRRIDVGDDGDIVPLLCAAPHLCWALCGILIEAGGDDAGDSDGWGEDELEEEEEGGEDDSEEEGEWEELEESEWEEEM